MNMNGLSTRSLDLCTLPEFEFGSWCTNNERDSSNCETEPGRFAQCDCAGQTCVEGHLCVWHMSRTTSMYSRYRNINAWIKSTETRKL